MSKRRRAKLLVATGAGALLLTAFAHPATAANLGQTIPPPPAPSSPVIDNAGILTPAIDSVLGTQIAQDNTTGKEDMAVVTVTDTNGTDFKTFESELLDIYDLGDNGILIMVDTTDSEAGIVTGPGFEQEISNVTLQAIVDQDLVPPADNGEYATGVEEAVEGIRVDLGLAPDPALSQPQTPVVSLPPTTTTTIPATTTEPPTTFEPPTTTFETPSTDTPVTDAPPTTAAPASHSGGSGSLVIILVSVLGGLLIIAAVVVALILRRRKKGDGPGGPGGPGAPYYGGYAGGGPGQYGGAYNPSGAPNQPGVGAGAGPGQYGGGYNATGVPAQQAGGPYPGYADGSPGGQPAQPVGGNQAMGYSGSPQYGTYGGNPANPASPYGNQQPQQPQPYGGATPAQPQPQQPAQAQPQQPYGTGGGQYAGQPSPPAWGGAPGGTGDRTVPAGSPQQPVWGQQPPPEKKKDEDEPVWGKNPPVWGAGQPGDNPPNR